MELIGKLLVDIIKGKENNMDITYNWNIFQMERQSENGFVTKVYYSVHATDGKYNSSTADTINYEQTNETFKPYDELTKENVIDWVQTSVGKEIVEASLASKINLQKNPIVIVTGVPWENPESLLENN
jgi:hypothetical protein